jgi:hypothetical protein
VTTALDFPAMRAAQFLSEVTMSTVGISPEAILDCPANARQIQRDAVWAVCSDRSRPWAEVVLLAAACKQMQLYHDGRA